MARAFQESTLLIGSGNAGKVAELHSLLAGRGIAMVSLQDINLPEPAETETTFIGNAILKARYYATATGYPTLADDSGLQIQGLDEKLGVETKRFIEEAGGQTQALIKLQTMLENQDKTATLVCALALVWPDGHLETVEASCLGQLVFPPRGTGFGVDPIFQPAGYTQTFGENLSLKNTISHRATALRHLLEQCF
jgi:XTP/dITP diphosphohydrolase